MTPYLAISSFASKGTPYYDYIQSGTSITSAAGTYSLLTPLIGPTGIFATNLQITKPVIYGGGTVRYTAAVKLHGMVARIKMVGSQSSTIAAGDLYNVVRTSLYWTGESYQSASLTYANNVDNNGVQLDVLQIMHDHTFDLPTRAYDVLSNYNVPDVQTLYFYVPLSKQLDCFTTTGTGTVWDTKRFDLLLDMVSDSVVTPNPQASVSFRVYYDLIQ